MTRVQVELELPDDLSAFRLPKGLEDRLQELLDRQDGGVALTEAERSEAEGLVDMVDMLRLLRVRAEQAAA